jgi:hypothetical protein
VIRDLGAGPSGMATSLIVIISKREGIKLGRLSPIERSAALVTKGYSVCIVVCTLAE